MVDALNPAINNPVKFSTRRIHDLVLYGKNAKKIRKALQESLPGSDLSKISQIKASYTTLGEDPLNKGCFIVHPEVHQNLIKLIQGCSDDQDHSNYHIASSDDFMDLSPQTEKAHTVQTKVSNILERVFNRRTGALSWITYGILNGLKIISGDSFKDVSEALKGDSSVIFAEKLSKHFNAPNADLSQTFKDDIKGQSLAKIVLGIANLAKKLPDWFINKFPLLFSIQNVSMPFISWMSKGSAIGKVFETIRLINPFADEFLNTYVGLLGDELLTIKECLTNDKDDINYRNSVLVKEKETIPISTITLSDVIDLKVDSENKALNAVDENELFQFQQARDQLSAAVKRLTRPRNISGLITKILFPAIGHSNYEDFEGAVIKKPNILYALYTHLKEIKSSNSIPEILNVKGLDVPKEQAAAKGMLALFSVLKNIPDWVLETGYKSFGAFYSGFYLFMPIVSKVIGEKSFMGKMIHYSQMVIPFINDVFIDIIASAFEETKFGKEVVTKNENLFKGLPTGGFRLVKDLFGKFLGYFKQLGKSVRDESAVNLATE